MELADLLTVDLCAVEHEPQTFLEGKLLVSNARRRQVEIQDILTWTEAFTAIADLVEWILVHNYYVTFLRHYLDDFLTLGPPSSPVCHNNLQTCVRLGQQLGLPLHPDKLEGPVTRLTILGIEARCRQVEIQDIFTWTEAFTAIADLVEWILVHNYHVTFLRHYLDDFLTLGPPSSPVCHNNLQTCVRLCQQLGLPLHPDKLEGPATRLTILGIELNSETLQARLPAEKRDRIVTLLDERAAKRFCKRSELESLIGHLHHAYKVAPQGRTFLRRMINLLSAFRREDHPIRLNQEFRRDLTWWRELFQTWDGLCFFCMPTWAPLPDFQVSSDAAGSLGYGAIFKSH